MDSSSPKTYGTSSQQASLTDPAESASASRGIWYWLALFFSVGFHPLIMLTLGVGLIVAREPGLVGIAPEQRLNLLSFLLWTTWALPVMINFVLIRFGFASSLSLEVRGERILPLALTSLVYLLVFYFFYRQAAHQVAFLSILGGVSLSILAVALINLFWKISAHATGMGGIAAILYQFHLAAPEVGLGNTTILWVVLTGAVLSSRLYLGAHTLAQTIAGLFLGGGICYGCVSLFL